MRKLALIAILTSVLFSASATAATPEKSLVKFVKLSPTVLFTRGEPLMQVAKLTLENHSATTVQAWAEVSMEGCPKQKQDLGKLSPGKNVCKLQIPDIKSPQTLRISVSVAGLLEPVVHEVKWQPQRHWVVYLMKSSHTDLGYETTEFAKLAALAKYVDNALKITDNTWSEPDASRYRWTIEHLWWLRGCVQVRSWEWYRRLMEDYVKTGKTAIMAPHAGVHSHWHSLEQLCRSMYWSRRHLRDQFGVDLPLYFIADNPSVAWPVAQAWALAGGRYVVDCRQSWRTKGHDAYSKTGVPKIFWWLGPDQKHKVLFAYPSSYSHGHNSRLFAGDKKMKQWINSHLQDYENGKLGNYPYDLALLPIYGDHEPPKKDQSDTIIAWNRRWQFPELRIDDPGKFMAEMERRYGDKIPTLSGDMNNYSADYAAAKPDQVGTKRAGALRLASAESFASIAKAISPSFLFRQPVFNDAYRRLCEHDDHTWPTGRYPKDHHEVNFATLKRHNAYAVSNTATKELNRATEAIAGQIKTSGQSIAVFNALPHERSDIVRIPLDKWPSGAKGHLLADAKTGEKVPTQIIDDQVVFLAKQVPAMGYRTYRVDSAQRRKAASPSGMLSAKLSPDGALLENDFYQIRFDPKTGTIRSLRDKRLDRELVDKNAPHQFNQFIYDRRISRESREGSQTSPLVGHVKVLADGPVAAVVLVEMYEPQCDATIRQTIRLYRNVDRVEIDNQFLRVRALWAGQKDFETKGRGRRIGKRYLHNIFVAFPFNVPQGNMRAEYSIGTVRPYDDQLRLGSHDYLSMQQYVNCSNEDYGVTWTSREASCVHFGEIRYNCFSNNYKPKKPWLYSYAMSNRMAGLGVHNPDQLEATLHYTITSHRGPWKKSQAAKNGWAVGHPMTSTVIAGEQHGPLPLSSSFVSIDAANVRMPILKPSELPGRGYAMRLLETQAHENTKVHVRVPGMKLVSVTWCNLVEDHQSSSSQQSVKLDADKKGFRLELGANELATLHLLPEGKVPQKVGKLKAEAVTDSSVRFSWPSTEGATCYRVYRLPAPDARPSLDFLLTETCKPSYHDTFLSLDENYYYRVSAVGAGNLESEASAVLTAHTAAENVSPPGPVREPIAVERNSYRVLLTWRSNRERDVVAYRAYRGENPDFPTDEAHFWHEMKEPKPHYKQWLGDAHAKPGKTYYYRVLAVDSEGMVSESSTTAVVSVSKDPDADKP